MHPSVETAWPKVAREHEGVCAWPYLDTVGKVTTGIGTLLDDGTGTPPDLFLSLPWTVNGKPATRAQAAAGWLLVKSRIDLAPKGGGVFRDITLLRLDDRTIDGLLFAKTREFWSELSSQLPGLEQWPADAQLGLLDMAYQLGPRFLGPKWPNFTAAAHSGDFLRCSQNCTVRQASAERTAHRVRLFENANHVTFWALDPTVLWDRNVPVKEDDVALSDADVKRIAEQLADLLADQVAAAVAARVKVPTVQAIAREVWVGASADLIKAPTTQSPENTFRPATVLAQIAKDVR